MSPVTTVMTSSVLSLSGQDAVGICEGGSLSISEQCREQVLFLYQHENVNNDIPCYAQCRSCRDCLLTSNNDTHLGELNSTLWETVYASYFADIPSNDTVDDDDSSEESSEYTHVLLTH